MYDHEKPERAATGNYCKVLPEHTLLDEGSLLDDYLYSRGLCAKLARENGWYLSRKAGDWHDRIVIPAKSEIKDLRFWQARYIGTDPTIKRYMSPHGPRMDALVVIYPDGVPTSVLIVEGPCDALAAAEVGALGIALLGATPSHLVLDHLAIRCQGFTKIVVLPDQDALDKGVGIIQALAERGVFACIARVPVEYKDLAEVPKERRIEWAIKQN
jgi:hypothetical protein